ncbi:hypothetical protein EXIGLDRAFT_727853 [Exidia glandulosa HHB12029]|uniref:F-box domain-containing protein n=1 Tax=Exidia glandulosa HHB12029 TaxID=1314781 RepID=A0A165LX53_EXIGL|nr:hypothetical protein EXIGLDRAFT_727853 [Exidia glandulosa HHB12029]
MSLRYLHDLPAELAVSIVEFAAGHSALQLLLVSSTIHKAVLPVLYHTVHVTPANYGRLARCGPTERRYFAMWTRRVIAPTISPHQAIQLVGLFTSQQLESVHCTPSVHRAFAHDPLWRPRMLVAHGLHPLRDVCGPQAMPMPYGFTGTHLFVLTALLPVAASSTESAPDFTHLATSNVTHVVLQPWVPRPKAEDLVSCFARDLRALLAQCPNIERILVRLGNPALKRFCNAPLLKCALADLGREDARLFVDDGCTSADDLGYLGTRDGIWTL